MDRLPVKLLLLICFVINSDNIFAAVQSIPTEELLSKQNDLSIKSTEFSPNEDLPLLNVDEVISSMSKSTSEDEVLLCVKCNTKKYGLRCLHIENTLYLPNCRSSKGKCYSSIVDGIFHRGCVGDNLFPDLESTGNKSIIIKLCDNNRLCNQDDIVDTCLGCSGESCANPILEMETACSIESTQGKGCYLRKMSSDVSYERGCMQHLSEAEQEKCQIPNSSYCQRCVQRNCNQKVSFDQKCFLCNGTRDEDCYEAKNHESTITCTEYSSVCLVGVDADGHAHRQCSSNTEEDTARFSKGYELCYGNLCNNQLFPKNWSKCFKCAKGRSCNHPSADLIPQFCKVHQDPCFIYGKEDDTFYRGCMSDVSDGRTLCEQSEANCYKCNSTQCNYLQSFQLRKLNSSARF